MLVKTARESIDVTQEELAGLLGLREASKISRIENGTRKPNGADVFSYMVLKMLEAPADENPDRFIAPSEIVEYLSLIPEGKRSVITACLALERLAAAKGRPDAVEKTTGLASPEHNEEVTVLGISDHLQDLKDIMRKRGEKVGGRAQDRYDRAAVLVANVIEIIEEAKCEEIASSMSKPPKPIRKEK